MSYFSQWSPIAGGIADNHGLDRSVFFGLIQQESSWNPNADAPGSSAFGFTQLLRGTAAGLGVNRFDPVQNLNGGAQYLSSLVSRYGGDYRKALAAYHDGPGALGLHGGFDYADQVLQKAKGYGASGLQAGLKALTGALPGGLSDIANNALNAVFPGAGAVAGALESGLGIGGDSCGINPMCYLQSWMKSSGFFERIALALVAFIILAAAFYLMNRTEINAAAKTAIMA